jgi:hypothetical protein
MARTAMGVMALAALAVAVAVPGAGGGSFPGAPGFVVFASNRAENLTSQLSVVGADASGRRMLTAGSGWVGQFDVARDGRIALIRDGALWTTPSPTGPRSA